MRKLLMLLLIVFASPAAAEDGYDLWLRYRPVGQPLADRYFQHASAIVAAAQTPALSAASDELQRGLSGLLGRPVPRSIETGDGSIIYRAEPGSEMADNWEVTTGDGSVTLYLPNGFNADIDAHTGDGSIRNDLDISGQPQVERENREDRDENKRTLRGHLGTGGKTIRVRTGDGAIRFRPS